MTKMKKSKIKIHVDFLESCSKDMPVFIGVPKSLLKELSITSVDIQKQAVEILLDEYKQKSRCVITNIPKITLKYEFCTTNCFYWYIIYPKLGDKVTELSKPIIILTTLLKQLNSKVSNKK